MSRFGTALDARRRRPFGGGVRAWMAVPATAAVMAALLSGCDTADEPADEVSEGKTTIEMNVDPTLVGDAQRFEAFGVQFSPPAGWAAMPQDQVAVVAAAVNGSPAQGESEEGQSPPDNEASSDNYRADPLAVFARPEEGLWLIVSAVNVPEPAVYTARLKERPGKVEATDFLLRGIEVHQYRLFPEGMVNFKLLVSAPGREDPRRLQLDYVFPLAEYDRMGRILESSIGSLAPPRRSE